jgi:hypothetical protein
VLLLLTAAVGGTAQARSTQQQHASTQTSVRTTPGAVSAPVARNVTEGELGLGAIIEGIFKMSGPGFVGSGVTVYWQEWDPAGVRAGTVSGVRLRLTATYHVSVNEEEAVDPDDANITMVTLQGSGEFPLQRIPFDVRFGFALHRFGGDADPFWHYSLPVQAQWRPRWERRWVPRIGVGAYIFPAFDADDFAPLDVKVSRDENEAVTHFFVGIDYLLFPRR